MKYENRALGKEVEIGEKTIIAAGAELKIIQNADTASQSALTCQEALTARQEDEYDTDEC